MAQLSFIGTPNNWKNLDKVINCLATGAVNSSKAHTVKYTTKTGMYQKQLIPPY